MKYGVTVVITLAVLVLAAIGYVWSGFYNIAATEPHWRITTSMINTLRNRSIAVHSSDASVTNLGDTHPEQAAFSHYHEMCRLCHGAPQYPPAEFAKGLYPAPPAMTSGNIQKAADDSELYWIIKHGIKMTGMPAFDPTHDEAALRSLVGLAQEIPGMDPEQYRHSVSEAREGAHGHMHEEKEAATDQNHESHESDGHDKTEEDQH